MEEYKIHAVHRYLNKMLELWDDTNGQHMWIIDKKRQEFILKDQPDYHHVLQDHFPTIGPLFIVTESEISISFLHAINIVFHSLACLFPYGSITILPKTFDEYKRMELFQDGWHLEKKLEIYLNDICLNQFNMAGLDWAISFPLSHMGSTVIFCQHAQDKKVCSSFCEAVRLTLELELPISLLERRNNKLNDTNHYNRHNIIGFEVTGLELYNILYDELVGKSYDTKSMYDMICQNETRILIPDLVTIIVEYATLINPKLLPTSSGGCFFDLDWKKLPSSSYVHAI